MNETKEMKEEFKKWIDDPKTMPPNMEQVFDWFMERAIFRSVVKEKLEGERPVKPYPTANNGYQSELDAEDKVLDALIDRLTHSLLNENHE